MVNFSQQKMQELMQKRKNIRNMAVIAHVDHGKTTLTDSLLAKAGMIAYSQAGDKRATDTRKDEQEKGITIKSTVVSMCFEMPKEILDLMNMGEVEGTDFMVNLVDSPGHVDFSPEVTAALRITDGAMVVVDAISGVCVQTETVLRQALVERIKSVLVINKVDRAIFEKQLAPEELFISLQAVINKVNAVISVYAEEDSPMGSLVLDPTLGNVVFASGLHGWAFSLRQFARMYSTKLKIPEEKMMKRLWGDNFYDPISKKWGHVQTQDNVRGFNRFILEPLIRMLQASKEGDLNTTSQLMDKLGLKLSTEEQEKGGKDLMRIAMKRWLPAADAMVEMIVIHLPSPVSSQAYRTACLYEGPLDDEAAVAMKKCDPEGPVMMYISKMVPAADRGRFYAVGRVFSGTVSSGLPIRVMGPDYQPGKTKDLFLKKLSGIKLMMGGTVGSLDEASCGNIVGLAGLDKYLLKTGTISTFENAHNIKVLKFSVSPVVRVAVDVVRPSDLRQLIEGMKRLSKSDPMVQCTAEGGQYVVAGAGELHLEICLNDLETVYAGVPIKKSDPVVRYCETVIAQSQQACLAKSGNKLNRLYMTAEPLPQGLPEAIDEGTVSSSQNIKERSRMLSNTFNMDVNQVQKIWCFGPEGSGPNMLVDSTFAVQHLQDIRDSVVAGFQWASSEGALSEETLRGVRFNLTDATIHPDPAHRGGGQIIPTTRRALLAAMLTAQPRLLEPVFMVEVQCTEDVIGGVMGVLAHRRGQVVEEIHSADSPLCLIKAHMPVNEGFGFTEELRSSTGGKAFPQCVFDHWQVLPGDPLDSTSPPEAMDSRERKFFSNLDKQQFLHMNHHVNQDDKYGSVSADDHDIHNSEDKYQTSDTKEDFPNEEVVSSASCSLQVDENIDLPLNQASSENACFCSKLPKLKLQQDHGVVDEKELRLKVKYAPEESTEKKLSDSADRVVSGDAEVLEIAQYLKHPGIRLPAYIETITVFMLPPEICSKSVNDTEKHVQTMSLQPNGEVMSCLKDYHSEWRRLATFVDFDCVNPTVFAVKLANDGFVFLPECKSIKCVFCGLCIPQSQFSQESPLFMHRKNSCPFKNGEICGNKPIPNQYEDSTNSSNTINNETKITQNKSERTSSMEGPVSFNSKTYKPDVAMMQPSPTIWQQQIVSDSVPMIQQPQPSPKESGSNKAKKQNSSKNTKVAVTKKQRSAENNIPSKSSASSSSSSVPSTTEAGATSHSSDKGNTSSEPQKKKLTYTDLGIFAEKPKRPDMATLQKRIASFKDKWKASYKQTPEMLSNAGMYYAGYADCARCFFCGGGLKNWEPPDDPWIEHARWFPKCAYIRMLKGPTFVDIVQKKNKNKVHMTLEEVENEVLTTLSKPNAVDEDASSSTPSGDSSTMGTTSNAGCAVAVKAIWETKDLESLEAENEELTSQVFCKICMDNESEVVFLPCGHLVACIQCAVAVRNCPLCRSEIKGSVRARFT